MFNKRTALLLQIHRNMSTLLNLPKLSSFTEFMTPDNAIKTKEIALENPGDVIRTPRILKDGSFSWSLPELRKQYQYLTSSSAALKDLGVDPSDTESAEFRGIVSGEIYQTEDWKDKGLPFPYSQSYAGWQFGQFAGQLGDGRVHNLFEVPKLKDCNLPSDKVNRRTYEVQLKGSGKTPYSRFADGKAVIRSSIREYIISEHLNAIGIPTTRALSLTFLPKTFAQRHGAEKCAIVLRFAESWTRLGTFDLYRWRHDVHGVRQLSRYIIDNLFTTKEHGSFPVLGEVIDAKPELLLDSERAIGLLTDFDKMYFEIILRNAKNTAMWQAYGFLNGVLNTDNTSVLGLSMDFGPFAIMDKFDRKYTSNSEDHMLRYSYANTPTAIWWNLTRLGEDLAHIIGAGEEMIDDMNLISGMFDKEQEDKIIKRATKIIEYGGELFKYAYTKTYAETFCRRLGIPSSAVSPKNPDKQLDELITPMLDMLEKVQCDFNIFFVKLQEAGVDNPNFDSKAFAESILPAEKSPFQQYSDEELTNFVAHWLKIYQGFASSTGLDKSLSEAANPKFLPRNWIFDEVIAQVEESQASDLTLLRKLEKMAFHPFDESKWGLESKDVEERWLTPNSEAKSMLQCSCSS